MEFNLETILKGHFVEANRNQYEGKEHGNAIYIDLASEEAEEILNKCCPNNEFAFNPYSEGLALYIYADGYISITDNVYNNRSECYIETEQYHFENDEKENVIKFINYLISQDLLHLNIIAVFPSYNALVNILQSGQSFRKFVF